MSELDTKDYYDFYGFNEDRHEKIDSSEEVIEKPDHEYVVGVIVIAASLRYLVAKVRSKEKFSAAKVNSKLKSRQWDNIDIL